MKNYLKIVLLGLLCAFTNVNAQQDPQYTQYINNTQVVNPAYLASVENIRLALLYRSQWSGINGAPNTGTFSAGMPIAGGEKMALGLSLVADEIGPQVETNFTVDYAYKIRTSATGALSFGLKAGIDLLDIDFTKLGFAVPEAVQNITVDQRILPQLGAGVYYYNDRFYAGASVPNFLSSEHFEESQIRDLFANNTTSSTAVEATSVERLHFFFITGYVFDISNNLKFKPAGLLRVVSGAPLNVDLSANVLLNNKLTLGLSYRFDAAISAVAGFNITNNLAIGFAYDYQTNQLNQLTPGSYEIFLRYNLFGSRGKRLLSPRFF